MSFQNHLTYNLNFLIKNLKISTNTLSKETGIRQATIYKLKEGIINNPTIETLYPIAKYFKCTIDELMSIPFYSSKSTSETCSRLPLLSISEVEKFPDVNIIKYINTDFSNQNGKYCIQNLEDDNKFEKDSILIIDTNLQYQSQDYVIVKRFFDNKFSIKRILYDDYYFLQSIVNGLENNIFNLNDYKLLGVIVGSIKYYKKVER
jgi:transcriptional regulator with XRE-family HTH domain